MRSDLRAPLVVVALLLAVAMVLVWRSTLVVQRWESCRSPDSVGDTTAIPGSVPQETAKRTMLSDGDFLKRRGELAQRSGAKGDLPYLVVRSDNATLVFAEPSRALVRPLDPDRFERRWLDVDGESVPVHIESQELPQHQHIAAYVFEYDDQAVEALLPLQLRTAVSQVVRGTRPITQYAIHGIARKDHPDDVLDPALEWLAAAWRRHRAICGP